MGSSIDCWIEYDAYGKPPFAVEVEALPLNQWYDLRGAKDYRVFGAISGVRNETGILPLFALRGLPPNAHWRIREEAADDPSGFGWLFPSEVIEALAHHNVSASEMSLEMRTVLHVTEFIAKEIGNDRVRFVFFVE